MAKISNTSDSSLVWSKDNTPPRLVGAQTYTATMEINMAVPQKTIDLPQDPATSLLGIYPKSSPRTMPIIIPQAWRWLICLLFKHES